MVFAKSSSPSSGSNKLRKKISSVTNRTTSNTNKSNNKKRLKSTQTPKKNKNKKNIKKSKKINKLLNNNDEDTTDSVINNYNIAKKCIFNLKSNNTVTNNSKKNLDTYDFDETNDSYENVEIFNSNNKIMSPSSNSSSSSSTSLASNYEGQQHVNDENNNYYEDDISNSHDDNCEKLPVHQYSKENLLTQSKIYHQKLTNLKSQLETLKKLSKLDNNNNNIHIPDTIPEIRNYVQDYINDCNKLDKESSENLLIVEMWHEKQKLEIDRQRDLELLRASSEYNHKLKDLKQKLINQQLDLNKQLDIERNILDLNTDPADINYNVLVPVKRKLRRRNTTFNNDKLNHNKIIKSSNSVHNLNNITNNISLNNNVVGLNQNKPINNDC